jgi:hypothetical protein
MISIIHYFQFEIKNTKISSNAKEIAVHDKLI